MPVSPAILVFLWMAPLSLKTGGQHSPPVELNQFHGRTLQKQYATARFKLDYRFAQWPRRAAVDWGTPRIRLRKSSGNARGAADLHCPKMPGPSYLVPFFLLLLDALETRVPIAVPIMIGTKISFSAAR
jgi:hypothetical protein